MAKAPARKDVWLLLAILVLACATRFHRLGAQSLWNDEGTSVALAQRDLPTITRNAAHDIHPPLYYYLLHFWVRLAGTSEAGARSLSAVVGVCAVYLVYLLGRRLLSSQVGLLASFFSAVSPLQVYYSQEARMYILVCLLGLASLYAFDGLLVSLGRDGAGRKPLWAGVAYLLATLAALYSHYFAAALLVVHNIAFAWWLVVGILQRNRPWREEVRATGLWAGLQVLVVAAYMPWILVSSGALRSWPAVSTVVGLNQLLASVAARFSFGMAWAESAWLKVGGLALACLALLGLGHREAQAEKAGRRIAGSLLAALQLFLPVVLLYVLSLRRPMYNVKFLLMAAPALSLLQAGGAIQVARWVGQWAKRASVGRIAGGALVAAVMVVAAVSLGRLYYEARYFRDDYRAIAAYIEATAGEEDAILINAPSQVETVNYYYRGALREYLLPAQRPAKRSKTEAALQEMIAQHPRIYAILWATDESDSKRIIENWLDVHCYKAMDSWLGNVRLAVYAAPMTNVAETTRPLDYTFGEEIRLRSYALSPDDPRSGDILQLSLYWEALRPISRRYKVFVHLVDERGNIAGQRDSEPGAGTQPTTKWKLGEAIADNTGLLVQPATPPGEYVLWVGLYDAESGRRLPLSGSGVSRGDALELGRVQVRRALAPPPSGALDMRAQDQRRWGALGLLGHSVYRLGAEHERDLVLKPGDAIKVILFWRRESGPVVEERIELSLGRRWRQPIWRQSLSITGGAYPPAEWREGEIIRDIQQCTLPSDLEPGTYTLWLRVGEDGESYALQRIRLAPG